MASNRLWGNREAEIVILDTSAIMMLFEFSIDLEDELTRLIGNHHIVVPKPVIDELKILSERGKGKKRFIARPALDLVSRYEIVNRDAAEKVDDAVLSLAKELQGVVITNDRELRKKLKAASLKTIYLRGKKQLVLD